MNFASFDDEGDAIPPTNGAEPPPSSGGGQHRADMPSLGDEAAKLLAVTSTWLQSALGTQETSKIATGANECEWCPVCQLISVLRGDKPEVNLKLVETQQALAGLMHAVSDAVLSTVAPGHNHTPPPPPGSQTEPNAAPNANAAPKSNGARVQKIHLDLQRHADEPVTE